LWPNYGAACAGLAFAMGVGGALLRWMQDGDVRARIAGRWAGITFGILVGAFIADRAIVERLSRNGGAHRALYWERIESASECLKSRGQLVREVQDCTTNDRGQKECDSDWIEVPCSMADAHRDLDAIYAAF